ncbi:hypothetical protein, partial [Pseudomonas syringae group genomosp. 7]|uniref:hypothetical protein n=1 Tax=Pseudomonas syringae group genomosp. 7 TaxID=251699 RepID=UPI00376FD84E
MVDCGCGGGFVFGGDVCVFWVGVVCGGCCWVGGGVVWFGLWGGGRWGVGDVGGWGGVVVCGVLCGAGVRVGGIGVIVVVGVCWFCGGGDRRGVGGCWGSFGCSCCWCGCFGCWCGWWWGWVGGWLWSWCCWWFGWGCLFGWWW